MSSSTSDARDIQEGRLGGARADFVASLGRKVNDARDLLSALEDDPSSKGARDELRRRLHALGSGARLLRFDAMGRSLQEALAVLDRGTQTGTLREQETDFVARVLDDLPALAWGEQPLRAIAPSPARDKEDERAQLPTTVLVVGGEDLAEALMDGGATHAHGFECERSEDVQAALELARAYAPDIVLVDADLEGTSSLVEAMLDDPMTEPVPIVVVGTFGATDDAARFVALGVAKAMAKPVGSDVLRRICDEILRDAREGRTTRITLGEPTLQQLADRLADELKRALVDSVDRPALSCRVPLGEGTEVLGALWGAIARVQEIVTQKTGGTIRFGGDAPEGAIALAPWLHQDVGGTDRVAARGRGAAADVRLTGRRAVVADDDPGVTWFISDLLRTAGCDVHEALDGLTALDLAFRVQPDLVVSDILMPGMDGFALSRALRRDVALRDTPVILLSWKEDLLQRVRELGASAAAYMRKESDSRAILARVREVLQPRARIESRLSGDGEVRGRLDGLSPRLLLDLVCTIRKNARVAIRDASFLYEVEIRGGSPRKATCTASDGSYQSGERAVASLLGVGAGRFVVSPGTEPVRGELSGTLSEVLVRPIAAARGALAVVTGTRMMEIERIVLGESGLEEYLHATPDPARTLIRKLSRGASPRQMVLGGDVSPSLLEDVLADLAARGAIHALEGPDGADLLTPAIEAALGVLRGAIRSHRSVPPDARPSSPPGMPERAFAVSGSPVSPTAAAGSSSSGEPPHYETLKLSDPPASAPPHEEAGAPSSLEDAVMREISDRSANRTPLRAPAASQPSIIEPSELRPRSSNPPANESDGGDSPDERTWPSIPPDAIVPGATSSEEVAVAPSAAPDSALVPRLGRVAINAPDSSSAASQPKVAHTAAPTDSAFVSPFSISVPTPPIPLVAHAPPRPARAPAPARVDDRASRSNRLSRWLFVLLAFAFFGAAVWAAWRSGGTDALAP